MSSVRRPVKRHLVRSMLVDRGVNSGLQTIRNFCRLNVRSRRLSGSRSRTYQISLNKLQKHARDKEAPFYSFPCSKIGKREILHRRRVLCRDIFAEWRQCEPLPPSMFQSGQNRLCSTTFKRSSLPAIILNGAGSGRSSTVGGVFLAV